MKKIASYTSAFLLFVAVVAIGYQPPQTAKGDVRSVSDVSGVATVSTSAATAKAPSVDELVATGVAAGLAERANLPIASNVANMSVSLSAKSELAQTDDTTITKPQIIQPTATNRTIQTYVTKEGDTVQSVAGQFNVSPDTVRWANNLQFDAVAPNTSLAILPVNGVRYTFKAGDTVDTIAAKYGTDASRITSYNDLELNGAADGQVLIVPGGTPPESERPGYVAPVSRTTQNTNSNLGRNGGVINMGVARASAGNRYAPGNCTWYAYERRAQLGRPVGSFWGNANTWAMNARAAGYLVNNAPAAGAVLVDTAGYYGHVGVVERVLDNGDIVITEMNNYAYGGFNVVNTRTISAGQAAGYQYIH